MAPFAALISRLDLFNTLTRSHRPSPGPRRRFLNSLASPFLSHFVAFSYFRCTSTEQCLLYRYLRVNYTTLTTAHRRLKPSKQTQTQAKADAAPISQASQAWLTGLRSTCQTRKKAFQGDDAAISLRIVKRPRTNWQLSRQERTMMNKRQMSLKLREGGRPGSPRERSLIFPCKNFLRSTTTRTHDLAAAPDDVLPSDRQEGGPDH